MDKNNEATAKILVAIETMQAQGEKINMRTIHRFLGGGSFSTIGPVLKQWRSEQKPPENKQPDMPDSVRLVMEKMTLSMWQATWQAMAESESSELCAIKDEMQQREIDREVLEFDFINLQNELNEAHDALEREREGSNQLRDELTNVKCDLAAEKERCTHLQKQSEQLQTLMTELNEQLAQIREQNAALKTALSEKDNELNELQQSMSQADIRLAGISSELYVCRDERDALRVDIERKNELLDEQSQAQQELKLAVAQYKKAAKEAEKQLLLEQEKQQELTDSLSKLNNELSVEREANRISQESIERMCNNRLVEVQKENQSLLERIRQLEANTKG